jgi:hypothetical protein
LTSIACDQSDPSVHRPRWLQAGFGASFYALSGATIFCGRITQFVVSLAASLQSSPALRRHTLATALLRPNQSPHAKNYERDPLNFSHDRPDRRGPQYPHMCAATSTPAGFPGQAASLEVFVPCNAHWLRSRCPGRPASGRSRFGVSILRTRRPARLLFKATCRRDGFSSFALAVFRWSGFVAMKLAWRTRFRWVRSVPIESVARAARVSPMGPVSRVRVGG